jgi:SAM-dependent methyltransferase
VPDSTASGTGRPNVARVYDYFLGGSYNFAVDRTLAGQVVAAVPDMPWIARAYRHFLVRAVGYCLRAGVRQFLDIGCGVPSAGAVHEVALRADPGARVVCVDTDPVAAALTRSVVAGTAGVCVFEEDLRLPQAILAHTDLRQLLDLRQPVAVVLGGVLQFLTDADDPPGVVGRLLAPLAAGSHLVVSHATTRLLCQQAGVSVTARSRAQIEDLFTGLALVDPGVVWLPQWRREPGVVAEQEAHWSGALAGVCRKP